MLTNANHVLFITTQIWTFPSGFKFSRPTVGLLFIKLNTRHNSASILTCNKCWLLTYRKCSSENQIFMLALHDTMFEVRGCESQWSHGCFTGLQWSSLSSFSEDGDLSCFKLVWVNSLLASAVTCTVNNQQMSSTQTTDKTRKTQSCLSVWKDLEISEQCHTKC